VRLALTVMVDKPHGGWRRCHQYLGIPVLPWTARLDVDRLDAVFLQPTLDHPRNELRAVVAPDVFWHAVLLDGFGQHPQHIFRLDRPIRMDAVAFPCVFINQIERPQLSASLRVIAHKIPCPHMVPMPRLLWQPRGYAASPLPWLGFL